MNVALERITEGPRGAPTLLMLGDFAGHAEHAQAYAAFASAFGEGATVIRPQQLPGEDRVVEFTEALLDELEASRTKRVVGFGVGRGGSVVQELAIRTPRLVRHVILLNSTTRLAPNRLSRAIDKLERLSPFGLPLRRLSRSYDSRPSLHRLRCPLLVLTEPDASLFVRAQTREILSHAPNAWHYALTAASIDPQSNIVSEELAEIVRNFLEVPTKRPQKTS